MIELRVLVALTGVLSLTLLLPYLEGRPLVQNRNGVFTMSQCLPRQRPSTTRSKNLDNQAISLVKTLNPSQRLRVMQYILERVKEKDSQPCPGSLVQYLTNRDELLLDVVFASKQLNDTESNLHFDITCYKCETIVWALKIISKYDVPPEDLVVKSLSFICTLFEIEKPDVCHTVIKEFKNEFYYTASHLTMPVSRVCGILVPECSTFTNPLNDWNVSLPDVPKPPVVAPTLPSSDAPKLRILHLSDIHMDFNYMIGANAECGEPLCCNKVNGPGPTAATRAGKWGDYRKCDIPYQTLENLFSHLNKSQKFDMIYWTGDLPPHNVWDQTRDQQVYIYQNLTNLFLKYFPKIPVYSTLGNHESAPVDSFPPPYVKGNLSISWLYNELEKSWNNWVPPSDTPFVKKGAYYTHLIRPGFRVISINMNYCNMQNWWLMINHTDPTGELKFLVDTLQYAEDHKERVHIIGHIPPGSGACLKTWSWNYYRIINRYESTIAAQFFGHTHNDQFELFYDEKNTSRVVNIAYIGPSVTTYPDLNPGYRIYSLDGDHAKTTRLVLDHETYYMNITDANLGRDPVYKLMYSAKDTYKLKNLLPSEWDNLVRRFETDDALFTKYYRFYFKLAPNGYKPCTGQCKENYLCAIKSGRSYDNTFC